MISFLKKKLNEHYFYKNGPKSFTNYYDKINRSEIYLDLCNETQGLRLPIQNNLDTTQFEKLYTEISQESCESILDLGCGNGSLLNYISNKFKIDIDGIDFSNSSKHSKIITSSYQDMNLKSSYYDLIYCLDSFYLVQRQRKVFKKLIKSIKPNGKILFFHTFQESFQASSFYKDLQELSVNTTIHDFTEQDKLHWKSVENYLRINEESFFNEQIGSIYRSKRNEVSQNLKLHQKNQLRRLCIEVTLPR